MKAWWCIPSARPAAQVQPLMTQWRKQGYGMALWRDDGPVALPSGLADVILEGGPYPGYARSVNALAAWVLRNDPECQWIVIGGDDTAPDLAHTADEIADQCSDHFLEVWAARLNEPLRPWTPLTAYSARTMGVMQPTGDRFASGSIDRIAGSAWIGRAWCETMHHGAGPLHPGFQHCFVDECLQRTAMHLGVFWQRPDLIHLHRHFQRQSDKLNSDAVTASVPPHLVKWNTREHWDESKALFDRVVAGGFAECMP